MLTFEKLREINSKRNVILTDLFETHDWNVADWTNALAGEAGEAANFGKKLRRRGPDAVKHEERKKELAKELADVVLYADLCAAYLGVDLAQAVVDKFNEVSDRHGIDMKLEA